MDKCKDEMKVNKLDIFIIKKTFKIKKKKKNEHYKKISD